MRLLLLFATPLFIAAMGAGETVGNPTERPIGDAHSGTAGLSDFFSDPVNYFLQRFVQAASLGADQMAQTARQSNASETVASGINWQVEDNWAAGGGGEQAESFSLHYESDGLSLAAGRYTPSFGVSLELAPGAFSADYTREYEDNGRVGFGGVWQISDGDLGRHALSLNSYFFESALLDGSAWRNEYQSVPVETPESGALRNLSAALDGGVAPPLPNLFYHFAARYQSWGESSEREEFGYVAALHGEIELANGALFDPVLEYARFDENGEMRLDRQYLTFGVTGDHGPWNMSMTYSGRDSKPAEAASKTETDRQRLIQLMLRYVFQDGATIDLGHRRDGAGDTATQNLNVRFAFPL